MEINRWCHWSEIFSEAMYLDFKEKIRSDSAGITHKKIKGTTYIYYAYEHNYSPEKGYTVPNYPDYAFNHHLFTDRMKIYSDSKISDFINGITKDQSLAFLDEWNEKQDQSQKIYISYDSTNKNCQAGDIDFVEYGHPKEDSGAPVINYSVAYDQNNARPLYYEDYPRSKKSCF